MLGAMLEQGHTETAPAATELPASAPTESAGSRAFSFAGAHPRAAAAAILSMLAFGVVLGSFANANMASLARSVLVAVAPSPAAAPAGTATDAGSTSADSSGASSSGGGSSGAGGSVTPAATPTSTTPSNSPGTPDNNPGGSGGGPTGSGLPAVKHVFLIVLHDQGLNQTFGLASHDKYLAKTLPAEGELIQNYYGVAGSALANEIALVAGQGPTVQTEANCPNYTALAPGTKAADAQVLGSGCVYPAGVLTLGDQLMANGQSWKAYIQGIGNAPAGEATTCRHPQLGSSDPDQVPRPGDPYVTWRDPFVYFSGIVNTGSCTTSVFDIEQLATDLQTESKTPTFSYIVPSPCDDGSEQPCVAGAKSGLPALDGFLQGLVPQIEQSAAYKDHGLIAITFDEAPQTGPNADSNSCCNQPTYPNLPSTTTSGTAATPATAFMLATDPAAPTNPAGPPTSPAGPPTSPGTTTSTDTTSSTSTDTTTTTTSTQAPTTTTASTSSAPTTTPSPTTTTSPTSTSATTSTTSAGAAGSGGGQIGLVLISPLIKPKTQDLIDQANHYTLLATFEDLFGLDRLGYAKNAIAFDASVFNAAP